MNNNQSLLGFLNLDKPLGFTSHDCVAKFRRVAKIKRVGHGGTLDPAATGVLPLAVGKATRLLQFLPDSKAYEATIRFGWRTSSDDLEGEILEKNVASHLTLDQIKPHLAQFVGKISQIPPVYSAIQKEGRRLYELARQGKTIEVPPREVKIDKIEILNWQDGEFPELTLYIQCRSGTYIRSIARDLGDIIGTGGTLAQLRRTESSGFSLENSFSLTMIEEHLKVGTLTLFPLDYPLQHLEGITLSQEEAKRWCQGQLLPHQSDESRFLRIYDENGLFLGIGERVPPETLKPKTVIA
ncbi:tRNA pseudouridine(55) synthase TruB [Euhalothece natronophila Z-M001]|uniref:tRNA pseudouridine synthase B n=1 Tax=Euhalothece natronophila Z-M001 TaxID=522448 RepID=A0A5B8NQM2_9CHRO|nr:tRNA pseudouridine(55) synthase TruB [Euhalothece natronophila]QDZ40495.1 tRNA pseudouridine(55) synthase TruB [Euhalothece natronophila Z-M001]